MELAGGIQTTMFKQTDFSEARNTISIARVEEVMPYGPEDPYLAAAGLAANVHALAGADSIAWFINLAMLAGQAVTGIILCCATCFS